MATQGYDNPNDVWSAIRNLRRPGIYVPELKDFKFRYLDPIIAEFSPPDEPGGLVRIKHSRHTHLVSQMDVDVLEHQDLYTTYDPWASNAVVNKGAMFERIVLRLETTYQLRVKTPFDTTWLLCLHPKLRECIQDVIRATKNSRDWDVVDLLLFWTLQAKFLGLEINNEYDDKVSDFHSFNLGDEIPDINQEKRIFSRNLTEGTYEMTFQNGARSLCDS